VSGTVLPQSPQGTAHMADGASPPVAESTASRFCTFSRSLLADGEVVILELKPSPWFILIESAPLVVVGIMVLLVANQGLVGTWWESVLRHTGAWIIGVRVLWAMLQWACRLYVLTDRRVIRQRGVVNIRIFECRLDRLQNTFIHRTLVQRILGLGTIFFATAGTGQVEAMWQHVRRPAEVHKEVVAAIERFHRAGGDSVP